MSNEALGYRAAFALGLIVGLLAGFVLAVVGI